MEWNGRGLAGSSSSSSSSSSAPSSLVSASSAGARLNCCSPRSPFLYLDGVFRANRFVFYTRSAERWGRTCHTQRNGTVCLLALTSSKYEQIDFQKKIKTKKCEVIFVKQIARENI
jgi:hypothetical protein